MMGLLDDVQQFATGLLSGGKPYRDAIAGLLSGDFTPITSAVNSLGNFPTRAQVEARNPLALNADNFMNDPGVNAALGFAPMGIGSLKVGKYPEHGWSLKGQQLKSAIDEMKDIFPPGIPDKHQVGVADVISAIREKGLLPFTDVDKGGSVYVSALSPVMNSSGSMSMKSAPKAFGRKYKAYGYGDKTEPFQVRFSDHGQYYPGPVMSIDPISKNTPDTAKQYLEYILGNADRPYIGRSQIIPSTGEQYKW